MLVFAFDHFFVDVVGAVDIELVHILHLAILPIQSPLQLHKPRHTLLLRLPYLISQSVYFPHTVIFQLRKGGGSSDYFFERFDPDFVEDGSFFGVVFGAFADD